jgi:hypothetical protein
MALAPTCTTNTWTHTMYFCNGDAESGAGLERVHAYPPPSDRAGICRKLYMGRVLQTRHEGFLRMSDTCHFPLPKLSFFGQTPRRSWSHKRASKSHYMDTEDCWNDYSLAEAEYLEKHISSGTVHHKSPMVSTGIRILSYNIIAQFWRSFVFILHDQTHTARARSGYKSSSTSRISRSWRQ